MSAPGPMKDAGSAWPLRSEMHTRVRLGLWLWKALDAVKIRKLVKTFKAACDSADCAGSGIQSRAHPPTP